MSTPSVADLQASITALTTDKQTLTTQLAEANTAKGTLETQLGTANTSLTTERQKVTDLTKQVGDITKDRDAQTTKVADLEKNAKSTQQRAEEISAANGVPPAGKQEAATVPGNGTAATAGKQHYDAYQAAMKAGEGMRATEIWTTHQKAIEGYANSAEANARK